MEFEVQTLDPLAHSAFKGIRHHKPYMIPKQVPLMGIELKVIYLRIISSYSTIMQSCINLCFPPRDPQSCLDISGLRINPSEKASRPLNRHREDSMLSEFIYVNTDTVRFRGSCLPFEVRIQGLSSVVLVSGSLRVKGECKWVIKCKDGGGGDEINGGLVDAYFAGRSSSGKPLLLNGLVELKKKTWRGLDSIHEGNETAELFFKEPEEKATKEFADNKASDVQHFDIDEEEEMFVEEEGQLSWFNAGVRVGIGLGVGLSIGVGVGLGLIRRTYKLSQCVFNKVL